MGPYCSFCDHRCFVERRLPASATWRPGQIVLLATCTKGAEHDRRAIGCDHTSAINPHETKGEAR